MILTLDYGSIGLAMKLVMQTQIVYTRIATECYRDDLIRLIIWIYNKSDETQNTTRCRVVSVCTASLSVCLH